MEMNLKFIKARRESLGLFQKDLAQLLGFRTPAGYTQYENGNRRFKADMLPILAEALNCNIEDLYIK